MKKGIIFVPFMTGKGGTEFVIHNLFKSINNQDNYKLTVYSIGGSDNYRWTDDVDIHVKELSKKRPLRTAYYLTFLPHKIFTVIKSANPDFVISTNPVMWYLSKMACKRLHLNIPIIAWYHYSLSQKPIKKLFLKSADYYLAISSGIKQQLIQLGIPSNKIFLIFNPVVSDYHIIERPTDQCHFIYLGRVDLNKQKNVQDLLLGLSKVTGNWQLDIYGDDANAKAVKELAEKLKIEGNINWKGFINQPWHNITTASSLVLTSNYEGLPMVLCEAISHGIYCISSNIETGPSDIIKNDINGKLYQSHNIDELGQDLQWVIDNYKNLPEQEKIIQTSQKFSLTSYGRYFLNALDNIL